MKTNEAAAATTLHHTSQKKKKKSEQVSGVKVPAPPDIIKHLGQSII
jgi:hypothetical protein